jgi:hypothetical protein
MDVILKSNPNYSNNVESNKASVCQICRAIAEMVKPNLYDLISLNIEARGERCETKEEADIVFDVNDGITPFDTDVFVKEYL